MGSYGHYVLLVFYQMAFLTDLVKRYLYRVCVRR